MHMGEHKPCKSFPQKERKREKGYIPLDRVLFWVLGDQETEHQYLKTQTSAITLSHCIFCWWEWQYFYFWTEIPFLLQVICNLSWKVSVLQINKFLQKKFSYNILAQPLYSLPKWAVALLRIPVRLHLTVSLTHCSISPTHTPAPGIPPFSEMFIDGRRMDVFYHASLEECSLKCF